MKNLISKNRCIEICTSWHGGQWSALYQFLSSGVYMPENHLKYLKELQECREPEYYLHPGTISKKNDAELNSAQRWFIYKGTEIGIKTGWIDHPVYGYKIPTTEDQRCKKLLLFI